MLVPGVTRASAALTAPADATATITATMAARVNLSFPDMLTLQVSSAAVGGSGL
jgi:hypothetical protein